MYLIPGTGTGSWFGPFDAILNSWSTLFSAGGVLNKLRATCFWNFTTQKQKKKSFPQFCRREWNTHQKKKNFVIPSRNFAGGNFTTKKKKNWSSGTICHHPSHSLPPKSFPQCFGNDLSPRCTSFPPTRSRQTSGTPTPPYFPLGHLAPASHVTCRPRQTKHHHEWTKCFIAYKALLTPNLRSLLPPRVRLGKPRYLNPYPIAAFKPHLPKKNEIQLLSVWWKKIFTCLASKNGSESIHPTLYIYCTSNVTNNIYIYCTSNVIYTVQYIHNILFIQLYIYLQLFKIPPKLYA
jgi:hypothetical protein